MNEWLLEGILNSTDRLLTRYRSWINKFELEQSVNNIKKNLDINDLYNISLTYFLFEAFSKYCQSLKEKEDEKKLLENFLEKLGLLEKLGYKSATSEFVHSLIRLIPIIREKEKEILEIFKYVFGRSFEETNTYKRVESLLKEENLKINKIIREIAIGVFIDYYISLKHLEKHAYSSALSQKARDYVSGTLSLAESELRKLNVDLKI